MNEIINGRKEFRSERFSINRFAAGKLCSQRISPVRRHLVLNFLWTYWPKAAWRLRETSPGDWTFEGNEKMRDVVHGFIKGVVITEVSLSENETVVDHS